MKKSILKKQPLSNAFTLIELLFVIIVLGILASLVIPRLDRDLKQEAADTVLSAIRYTQHLALTDNKHKFNKKDWQQSLWMIRFTKSSGEFFYTVATNFDGKNNLDQIESAIDPTNGKYMHTGDNILDDDESPFIFLTQKYGINNVIFNDCTGTQTTTAKHIAFDNKGRPHRGIINTGGGGASNDFRTYIKNKNCTITFQSPVFDSDFTIEIVRETGFAFIQGQPSS